MNSDNTSTENFEIIISSKSTINKLQKLLDKLDALSEILDKSSETKNSDREFEADYKSFCEWVASEIFSDNWEINKDSFAEIACRKLNKLGIVTSEGDAWELKESEV